MIQPTAARDGSACDNTAARSGSWLQVLSHLDPAYGGLTAVVPALSEALLERTGLRFPVAAFCPSGESTSAGPKTDVDISVWPAGRGRWIVDSDLRGRFASLTNGCHGVHVHGLWEASAMVATRVARQQGLPYVLSAHGMLEPWALAQKALKKRLYAALIERPALQDAACLHALTEAEAEDFRNFGCTRPIAVIPNAVQAPALIDRDLIERQFPQIAGRRVVLFLGRLHAKKGVELLLQAWAQARAAHPDALLLLAGPGNTSYVSQLQAQAADLGVTEQVLFAGMLNSEQKWSALQRAHVFVLPSFSEGLSVATLESLCTGTPVIVTTACHLPEVDVFHCGWQIGPGPKPLLRALCESLEASPEQRAIMSANARRLARQRYSWDTVCAQFLELYACVLGGGRPQRSLYLEARR